VRDDLEDLNALRELQKLLLREVMRTEEKIRQLKNELRQASGTENLGNAKRVTYLNRRIEGFRQCAFVWRCFGDAIAFLYLDKFSLKQCFYSTETTNPKQYAGFISGKVGLARELAIWDSALKHGVPAVLVDLTNTIRHGDVCLLGGSDPYLIEAKVSKNLSSRGKQQKRNIQKLHSFYDTDESEGLRGLPKLQRRSITTPERSFLDDINGCIQDAIRDGHAVCEPEPGLHYLVTTGAGPDLGKLLDTLRLKGAVWYFYLNDEKANRTWAPYFPFVLSISDRDHLWKFIRGTLCIFVFVEWDALCKVALDRGCKATVDPDDGDYPLRIETPSGGKVGISTHILNRIGMEFMSPQWIVRSSLEWSDLNSQGDS